MTATSEDCSHIPAPGFRDPSRDAQRAFRAILDAMAHPTRRYPLSGPPAPPAHLGPGLAAVALTLLDESTGVWLEGPLAHDRELSAWLTFHTGVGRPPEIAQADFIFCDPTTRPRFETLARGSDEAPQLSATVVLDVRGLTGGPTLSATGPGIDGVATLRAAWADASFLEEWQENVACFPRGVDLLAVDEAGVCGLPRTTQLHIGEVPR